jgi:hypothetical protein
MRLFDAVGVRNFGIANTKMIEAAKPGALYGIVSQAALSLKTLSCIRRVQLSMIDSPRSIVSCGPDLVRVASLDTPVAHVCLSGKLSMARVGSCAAPRFQL